MYNKHFSTALSALFIFALISSTVISGAGRFFINEIVAGNSPSLNTPFSVRILAPASSTIKENQASTQDIRYKVQVTRQNTQGQFSVTLSTVSDTPALNLLRSFVPSASVNMEEGQSVKNTTLTIPSPRADSLSPGSYKFQVQAENLRTNPNNIRDQQPVRALSNSATLSVLDAQSKEVLTGPTLKSQQVSSSSEEKVIKQSQDQQQQQQLQNQQQSQQQQQQRQQQVKQVPNHPPVAKAGPNQQVSEGEVVILDASASTDADRGQTIIYSWKLDSKEQSLRIEQLSPDSPKAKFTAPQVKEDTSLTVILTLRDGSGGEASDSVNILVRDVSEGKGEQGKPTEERARDPNTQAGEDVGTINGNGNDNGNRPPIAHSSSVTIGGAKSLSISLQGTEPDNDDKLTFVIVTPPTHATIAGFDKASGSLTYIPDAGFTGKDIFKFKVTDSKGAESNEATVVVNVDPNDSTATGSLDDVTTSSLENKKPSATSDSAIRGSEANISKAVEDRLAQRQEIIDSKLKETRGEEIANQYIVVLKSGTAQKETQNLVDDAKSRGANIIQQYQKALKGFTINIANKDGLAEILNDSDVAYAEPDVKLKVFAQTLPSGIDRVDGDLSSALSGDGKGDAVNVDIAILDTGIDLKHPDLNVYKHVTFVPGTNTGNDDNGHGTMVAGIAGALDNGWGSVGIAPGARLWSIKVLDSTGTGSLSSVLQGLDFVTSNANDLEVADLSFGCENCASPTLNTAIDNAVAAGVTIVAAAGNGAKDASTFSPANNDKVIAVSAIADSDGKCGGQGDSTNAGTDDGLASFSNYGTAVDMAAPGVQIYSTSMNGGYSIMSGTSMAAPHVAGAAALYMSKNPNASPSQVLAALKSQSSTSSNDCDGKGHGYFTNDKDSSKEPLLYVGIRTSATPGIPAPQSNSTSPNNTTGTNPEPPSPPQSPSANTTNSNNNSNSTNNGNATTSVPPLPPISGNITGNLGNTTGINNQTSLGNQTLGNLTSNGNQTSGNQTFNAASGDTWYFTKTIGVGVLNQPHGVGVDPATGKVYVADTGNHRLVAFNADGTLDTTFDSDGFAGTFGNAGPEDLVFMPSYPVSGSTAPVLIVTDPGSLSSVPAIDFYSTSGALIQRFTGTDLGMTMPGPKPYGIGAGPSSAGFFVVDVNHREVAHYPPTEVPTATPGLHPLLPLITNPNFNLPLDVGCCMLPSASSPDSVFVTDPAPGTGITAYKSGGFPSFTFGCCNDQHPYGIDILRGPTSSASRIIFSDQVFQHVVSFDPNQALYSQVSANTGQGQVLSPAGIAVVLDQPGGDNTDTIYVAEHGNSRISVFANSPPDTTPPPTPTLQSPPIHYTIADNTPTFDWSDVTDPSTPVTYDLLVDDDNTFSTPTIFTGLTSSEFTMPNPGLPDGIYFWKVKPRDGAGNTATTTVLQFTIDTSPAPANCIDRSTIPAAHTFITKWGSTGPNNGQFSTMNDLAIDADCNVYVVDQGSGNSRIEKFSSGGTFISTWGTPGSADGQFSAGPTGIAIEPSTGYIYAADLGNNRIQKFTRDGTFIKTWGSLGSNDGQLWHPAGVAVDSAGNVYVSESTNNRIQKFSSTGKFILKWGGPVGAGDGQFNGPSDLAVDFADNSVYVTDGGNHRVQKFDSNGNFIRKWGSQGTGAGQFNFGGIGSTIIGITVVNSPSAPSPGTVYVSDLANNRIQLFDANGNPKGQFGTQGIDPGKLDGPKGIDVDRDGNVYVAEHTNSRVSAFTNSEPLDTTHPTVTDVSPDDGATGISVTPCVCITFSEDMDAATITSTNIVVQDLAAQPISGTVSYDPVNKLASFNPSAPLSYSTAYEVIVRGGVTGVKDSAGNPMANDFAALFTTMSQPTGTGTHAFLGKWGTNGLGNSQFGAVNPPFGGPFGVAVDPSTSDVYVTDRKGSDGQRIQKFKSDGTFLLTFGSLDPNWSSGQTPPDGMFSIGGPYDIAVDHISGDVYVTDRNANRVQKFDSSGNFLLKWGSSGPNAGQFNGPTSIAVDANGDVYVAESDGIHRIQKFDSSGNFLLKWGTQGSGDSQFGAFNSPTGIAFDSSGNVFVVDTGNARIQKFSPTGAFLLSKSVGTDQSSWDIALDSSNNVYVSQKTTNEILKFSPDLNTFETAIGSTGTGDGQFASNQSPIGIAINQATGYIYAADFSNNRVQFFGTQANGKHPTELSIKVPEIVTHDTKFTVSGTLTDVLDPQNPIEMEGVPITFTGSGAANVPPVSTQGVKFISNGGDMSISDCANCASESHDGTLGNKVLRLPEGGSITLPEKTTKVKLFFDDMGTSQFALDLVLDNAQVLHYTDVTGGMTLERVSTVPIASINLLSSPVGYAGISSMTIGDFNGFPEDQHTITFEEFDVTPTLTSPFVVDGGSFHSIGSAPSSAPASFQVEASYAGDATHEAATSGPVSFETSESSPGQGVVGDETVVVGDVPTTFNDPLEFANGNLCANLVTGAGDTDADGICDVWENPATTGNSATQRFITCPQKTGNAFIDIAAGATTIDCNNTDPVTGATLAPAKYNLCHTDMFPGTWSTSAPNNTLCPKVGHKDMFVEIDYTDSRHKPDPNAVKDVIMAFGNAPITTLPSGAAQVADDFGRTKGITLHVIVDEDVPVPGESASIEPSIKVWGDTDGVKYNDFDTIKHGLVVNYNDRTTLTDGFFGTAAERQADTTGRMLDMKHYVYRYGLFTHAWGTATCTSTSGPPSGIGELLGNDFVVSLGCNFVKDGSGHSVGSRYEQSGTLMHELGHTLNLDHGGVIDTFVGSNNYAMNCKANYLSVMAYTRQLPNYLGVTDWVGGGTWPGTALDYSRTTLIDLNEASLKETTGLPKGASPPGDPVQPAQKFAYIYKNTALVPTVGIGTTGSSVDWDPVRAGIQADTSPVAVDLNGAGISGCPESSGKVESSGSPPKSDWANIKLKFLGDPDAKDGAGPDSSDSQTSRIQELTGAMVLQMKEQAEESGVADPPDTTPPDTAIASAKDGNDNNVPQDGFTSSDSITFTFTGSDDVATFECSLDDSDFTSCGTSETLTSLQEGSHTFQVRALDGSGNVDQSPDSRTWTIDTSLPAAPAITSPATGTVTNDNTPTISGTATGDAKSVLIFDGATQIGTATVTSGAWSFTPTQAAALSEGDHTITAKAKDAADNISPTSNAISITVDTAIPTVASTNPADQATNVALSANILATFSEAMNPTTITTSTFTVMDGSTNVPGTVTLSTGGKTATFDPTSSLVSSRVYTATITTGAKDTAGNSLSANKVWTFTTQAASDTTPPDTSLGSATDGNGNSVPEGAKTSSNSITFSFTGTDNVAVTGFECALDTTTFTSCTSPKTYSFLTDGTHAFKVRAKDAANNIDATPASGTWTVDTVKPTVASTNPADQATNVVVSANILATFSEAMNPSTITTSTFTVVDGSTNVPVPGTVTLSTDGKTATFDPTSSLASSRVHTATITTGAKDTAGNSLAANKVWTFTTQALPSVTFNGVDQPINQDGSSIFKIASAVKTILPVQFVLKGPSGNEITDATIKFSAIKLSSTITGTVAEQTNSGTATSGDIVKYDAKLKRYVYNWATAGTTQGTWGIRLYLEAPYGSHTLLVGPNNIDNSVKLSLKQ